MTGVGLVGQRQKEQANNQFDGSDPASPFMESGLYFTSPP